MQLVWWVLIRADVFKGSAVRYLGLREAVPVSGEQEMEASGLRDEELFANSAIKMLFILSHPVCKVTVLPVPKQKAMVLYGDEEGKCHRLPTLQM
jgi:hypothetical protein